MSALAGRILLVEDHDDDAMIFERHLERARVGATMVRARSGREALQKAGEGDYDMVFLDQHLGDGNALALVADIRRLLPRAGIVFASGQVDERLAAAAIRLGAMDVLAKDEVTPENIARLFARWAARGAPSATPREEAAPEDRLGRFARHSHRIYEALLETMLEGCYAVDRAGLVFLANPSFERMIGRLVAGTKEEEFYDAATREELLLVRNPPDGRVAGRWRIEGALLPTGSGPVPVLLSGTPLLDQVGNYEGSFLIVSDLKAQKEVERRLREESLREPLTGLGNRRAFELEMEAALARAARSGDPLSLLLFDLDGLKVVNDTLGHPAGDRLLRAFARGLGTTARIVDGLYRLGGDEFAAILPGTGREGSGIFIERLRTVLASDPERPQSSVGVAVHPFDAQERKGLFDFADRLLYENKRARKEKK